MIIVKDEHILYYISNMISGFLEVIEGLTKIFTFGFVNLDLSLAFLCYTYKLFKKWKIRGYEK